MCLILKIKRRKPVFKSTTRTVCMNPLASNMWQVLSTHLYRFLLKLIIIIRQIATITNLTLYDHIKHMYSFRSNTECVIITIQVLQKSKSALIYTCRRCSLKNRTGSRIMLVQWKNTYILWFGYMFLKDIILL